MHYKDVDGNEVKWKPRNKPRANASINHNKAMELVHELFPYCQVYEECKIPHKKNLFLDIFIPDYNLVLEVDGRQHDKFILHYHKTLLNFLNQQKNDRIKEDWCQANNLILIRLKEKDNVAKWRNQIVCRLK